MNAYNWVFNRMNDEELFVKLTGQEAEYNLYFLWEEHQGTLQFCCQYDTEIPADIMEDAGKAVLQLNETMVLGHFDLPKSSRKPTFRHTALIKGFAANPGHISDLVDMALVQCERSYPTFKMLAHNQQLSADEIKLALMDTQGQS